MGMGIWFRYAFWEWVGMVVKYTGTGGDGEKIHGDGWAWS